MENRGHNENAVRLAALADDAQIALDRVARGEQDTVEGWVAYGAALNEGRALFLSDEKFGQWVSSLVTDKLSVTPNDHERAAAMWAAANLDQFHEARAAGNARTVRGIHAKWKEIEAERERARIEAERKAEAEKQKAEAAADNGQDHVSDEDDDAPAAPAEQKPAVTPIAEPSEVVTNAGDSEPAPEPDTPVDDDAPADAAPEADDASAKLRREFRKLSPEAQESDFVGLHLDLDDARQENERLKAENEHLKAQWMASVEGSNMGRVLGLAERRATTAEGRASEHLATAKRLEYRVKVLEKEKAELQRQLENQIIPMS